MILGEVFDVELTADTLLSKEETIDDGSTELREGQAEKRFAAVRSALTDNLRKDSAKMQTFAGPETAPAPLPASGVQWQST